MRFLLICVGAYVGAGVLLIFMAWILLKLLDLEALIHKWSNNGTLEIGEPGEKDGDTKWFRIIDSWMWSRVKGTALGYRLNGKEVLIEVAEEWAQKHLRSTLTGRIVSDISTDSRFM